MTVSTENATTPKSIKSRNSVFSISRGTSSNRDFGSLSMYTEQFNFLDLVDFGSVAFSVETVICVNDNELLPTHQVFVTVRDNQ